MLKRKKKQKKFSLEESYHLFLFRYTVISKELKLLQYQSYLNSLRWSYINPIKSKNNSIGGLELFQPHIWS